MFRWQSIKKISLKLLSENVFKSCMKISPVLRKTNDVTVPRILSWLHNQFYDELEASNTQTQFDPNTGLFDYDIITHCYREHLHNPHCYNFASFRTRQLEISFYDPQFIFIIKIWHCERASRQSAYFLINITVGGILRIFFCFIASCKVALV